MSIIDRKLSEALPSDDRASLSRIERFRRHAGKPVVAVGLALGVLGAGLVIEKAHELPASYSVEQLDRDRRIPVKVDKPGEGVSTIVTLVYPDLTGAALVAVERYVTQGRPVDEQGNPVLYLGQELDVPVVPGLRLADPALLQHTIGSAADEQAAKNYAGH